MISSVSNLKNTLPDTFKAKVWAVLVLGCLSALSHSADAQEVIEISDADFDLSLVVDRQLLAFEDSTGTMTIDDMVRLQPFSKQFTRGDKRGIYWMKFSLLNTSDEVMDLAYDHSRMSHVEFYRLEGRTVRFAAKSGEYKKKSELAEGDSRFHLFFKLPPQSRQDFYVRIQNTRDRGAKLLVKFKSEKVYYTGQRGNDIRNFLLLGAMAIFMVYAFTLFLIHRFAPYLWLSLLIVGFIGYVLGGNGYLVDWFFPNNPKELKVFTPILAHFGKFCLLMLAVSFFQIKTRYQSWYKVFQVLMAMYILKVSWSFYVLFVHEQYGLATLVTASISLIPNSVMIFFVLKIRKHLDNSEKVFATGLLVCAASILIVECAWLFFPSGRAIATILSTTVIILEILFFAIALGIRMRQHEVDKNIALDKLNTTLKEQNRKIESEVVGRTKEINAQKLVLEERNDRIETLFKEVHHRVKNNLQLVSSLLNMQQEWSSTEDPAKAIEDSRSRVVAMSMIHQFLYRTDDIATIDFKEYAEELVSKLDAIQVKRVPYKLQLEFESNRTFDIDTSISLGLILNELVTNSYKHAVLSQRKLELTIGLKSVGGGMFDLQYKDNGEAIKEPFAEVIKKGFGLRLASRLAKQLQGRLDYVYDKGNLFTIRFADEEARNALNE